MTPSHPGGSAEGSSHFCKHVGHKNTHPPSASDLRDTPISQGGRQTAGGPLCAPLPRRCGALRQRFCLPHPAAHQTSHHAHRVPSRLLRWGTGGGASPRTDGDGRGFSRGFGREGRKERKHAAHHSRRGARRRLRKRQVGSEETRRGAAGGGQKVSSGLLLCALRPGSGGGVAPRKVASATLRFKEKINILFGFGSCA